MDNLIKIAQDSMWVKPDVPSFKSGDTITVTYRIVEGSKERAAEFPRHRNSDQGQRYYQNVHDP